MPSPRILVVGYQDPLSPPSGAKLRFDATVRGLAAVGTVDYLQGRARPWRPGRRRRAHPASRGDLPITEHVVAMRRTVPDRLAPAYSAVRRLLDRHTPPEVGLAPRLDRRAFTAAAAAAHDLLWCYQLPAALAATRHVPDRPTVVDLVDLGDTVPWRTAAAWVATSAARTLLCNPDEAAVIGVDLLDNGTDVPPPRPDRPVGACPRLLFLGWMHYPPNTAAARYLVEQIVPRLRGRLDRFEVRIVGRAPDSVVALGAVPEVTVTGFVPDAAVEVEAADLVVVPLLEGTGTRLKILEAFAHRTPVVSTAVGAAGLAVEDGRQLLIADAPDDFAAACARLLADDGLRRRMIDDAYARVSERYAWPVIEADVARIAGEVLDRR